METVVNLLVINLSPNVAEEYVSALRNAGVAVHAHYPDDPNDIGRAISLSSPDLIICSDDESAPLVRDITTQKNTHSCDASLIVIGQGQESHEAAEAAAVAALSDGAQDYVNGASPHKLRLVIQRELEVLNYKRQLAGYREKLEEVESRYRSIVGSSTDSIAYIQDGMHIYTNQAYVNTFGYDEPAELEGLPVMDLVMPESHQALKKFIKNFSRNTNQTNELNVVGRLADGETFDAVMEFSRAQIDGEPCTQILIRCQSSSNHQRELEEQIQLMARLDNLTGLFNRHHFLHALDRTLSDEQAKPGQVLMHLDIDHFRDIREAVGLEAADHMLQQITGVLWEHTSEGDLISRIGDHEFAIFTKEELKGSGKQLAEQVFEGINRLPSIDTGSAPFKLCIGITRVGKRGNNAQELLTQAISASKQSQDSKSGGVTLHNPLKRQGVAEGWAGECIELIQNALQNNGFELHFQPIVSLTGNNDQNYAVLTRLPDGKGDLMTPDKFIPVAEENDLVALIDRWVIRESIRLASQRMKKTGGDSLPHFFMKISIDTLRSPKLIPWIKAQLQQAGVPGKLFTIQLRDTEVVNRMQDSMAFIKSLHALGLRFALDQYGEQQALERLLRNLTVDYLKLNGDLLHESGGEDALKAMCAMAQEHDIQTVVRGVEDANSLAVLWTLGVDYLQGHFLQPPDKNLDYDFSVAAA